MAEKFETKDVTVAKSGREVVVGHYWLCENGDPRKALFYGQSRQCNKNKTICEHLLKTNSLYKDMNLSIVLIPVAYAPMREY